MKTNKLLLVAGMLAAMATSPAIAAERVIEDSELPPSVKKTVESARHGEPVKKISVRNAGGRTVYDVELGNKETPGDRIRIAQDGQILGDTRKASATASAAGTTMPPLTTPAAPLGYPTAYPGGMGYEPYTVPVTPRLRLEDLPKAAQATIQREAANREIAAIHEDSLDGRKAYVAQFSESGRNPRVYVAENGDVLRPTEKPPVLAVGTTFAGTPAPVQQSLRRELGDAGEIVRIDKDHVGGADVYRVEAKDPRGTYQLRLSADGRVLENSRRSDVR